MKCLSERSESKAYIDHMEDKNKKDNDAGKCEDGRECLCDDQGKCVEENVDYKDAYLRSAADYDNLKKETAKLRGEYAKYAASEVVEQVLPVLDNMKKALEQAPADESCAKWVEGGALIREQLEKVLEAAGVTAIGAEGEQFDPNVHEALMREKREGAKPDTVAHVVEPGYKIHDKTLRPAKVIVAE
jgi:molecular chaperone GrpE